MGGKKRGERRGRGFFDFWEMLFGWYYEINILLIHFVSHNSTVGFLFRHFGDFFSSVFLFLFSFFFFLSFSLFLSFSFSFFFCPFSFSSFSLTFSLSSRSKNGLLLMEKKPSFPSSLPHHHHPSPPFFSPSCLCWLFKRK